MNICRNITCNNQYMGTFKLTFIDGKYWWLYNYKDESIEPLGLIGRIILNRWAVEEMIEFREEDLYDN